MPAFSAGDPAFTSSTRAILSFSSATASQRIPILGWRARTSAGRLAGPVSAAGADAGRVAARAGVRRLILTHIDPDYHGELAALTDEARAAFGGEVEVARELERYD